MYEDANYYYQEGQKEVYKKKKPSIIPMALFLALLDQPNYSGLTWKQYIEVTMQYNAQQIYRQVVLGIQQQKELEIDSSEFQNIIKRQNNQRLNINGNKISGATDLQMIGLNNLAKVEGIKSVAEDNSKVRFIAVEDDKTTLMCDSLNNQEFYINKENAFDRYYGENQKDLKLQRIRCNGLVVGLNLAPIQHHFHFCRSTITYIIDKEKYKELELKYQDITNQYRKAKRYKVIEQKYYYDGKGNKYEVDNKYVILKPTEREKEVANILGRLYGGKIRIIPRINEPAGIKTPDYIINNEKFDLKQIKGIGKYAIEGNIKGKQKQANNFIIDITQSKIDAEEAIRQIQSMYSSKHYQWVDKILLLKDDTFIKIYKRK